MRVKANTVGNKQASEREVFPTLFFFIRLSFFCSVISKWMLSVMCVSCQTVRWQNFRQFCICETVWLFELMLSSFLKAAGISHQSNSESVSTTRKIQFAALPQCSDQFSPPCQFKCCQLADKRKLHHLLIAPKNPKERLRA